VATILSVAPCLSVSTSVSWMATGFWVAAGFWAGAADDGLAAGKAEEMAFSRSAIWAADMGVPAWGQGSLY